MRTQAFTRFKSTNRPFVRSRGLKWICGFLVICTGISCGRASSPAAALKFGSFRTTFYYVVNEAQYPKSKDVPLKDMDGNILADVNAVFKKDMDIEGTGILRSGKTVNYAGRVDGDIRYRVIREKWGLGKGRCALKPYRTIAVDPRFIPLGSMVYIPAVKGMVLPDNTVHDGIFMAEDIGSAIKNYHIDLFSAEGLQSMDLYEQMNIHNNSYVDVYKVRDPDPHGCTSEE